MPDANGNLKPISVPDVPWHQELEERGQFSSDGNALPIHGPNCTQIQGECVGYHCSYCGQTCSSMGHSHCLDRARANASLSASPG